jgi:CDP-diacylglycerol--glycerol-3-phosphate 3-phosphatidyltransferase
MNLPNKLTMVRIAMIPVFLLFFYLPFPPQSYLLALVAFAAAACTDAFDGYYARKHGLITDFGKLMDPLADKLLVTAALCCLLPDYGVLGTILLVLILSREFLVTSVRLIAAGADRVLPADGWGKAKTIAQMAWICLKLLTLSFPQIPAVPARALTGTLGTLFYFMMVLTVISGSRYMWMNRELFADAGGKPDVIERNDDTQ